MALFAYVLPISALIGVVVGMAIYALSFVENPDELSRTAGRTFRMMINIALLSAVVSCGGAVSQML